jgi:cytochrome b6-f complex iron-sulfur subunit
VAKQQRRVFLKVLAAGPLAGCADAAPEGSAPGGGGTDGMPSGGAGGSGSPSFPSGGNTTSGGTFVTAGRFGADGGSATSGGPASAGAVASGGASPGMVVGNLSSIPVGSLSIVAGLYFLGRDEQGLYAMSMQCTHKGCVVALAGQQLFCSCHESRFDGNGEVLQGPATTPLPHYAVFVDAAGNISVDRFVVVSGSARTPV